MNLADTPHLHKTDVTGSPFRVLNLYACLGGNRYKWTDCEVTAVELDPELARMYQERFPNDKVIIADAHQYLLDHYKEFDFITSITISKTALRNNSARLLSVRSIPIFNKDLKLKRPN